MDLSKKVHELILRYTPYFYETDVFSIIDVEEYDEFMKKLNIVNLSPEDVNPAFFIIPLNFKIDNTVIEKLRKYYNTLKIYQFVEKSYKLLFEKYSSNLETGDTEAWYKAKIFDMVLKLQKGKY